MHRRAFIACVAALLAQFLGQSLLAANRPVPDFANEHYGPHREQVFDLWIAKTGQPTPLLVYVHGGGFHGGSKESVSPVFVEIMLARGISVMAIDYRLSPEVHFPDHFLDAGRAVQYARTHAREWRLDPHRVGGLGGSTGGATLLWLAFHDDLADPQNSDPVLRESTRLSCISVNGGQSSLDPRVIRQWVGEAAARHPALAGFYGIEPEESASPKAYALYEAASPMTYLTRDDPPVFGVYEEDGAIPEDAPAGVGIHHVNFGLRLKEQMDRLGIECTIHSGRDGADAPAENVSFLTRHLLAAAR